MADLSITAASVARVSGSLNKDFLAGTTVTAGQPVYLNTGTNNWLLALATGSALQAGVGTKYGIAMHAALNGQPLAVMQFPLNTTAD